MKNYDVFISYRRDGGSETAKQLRDALTEKGYKVFYDIDSMRTGEFNLELYRVIENTKDFILILPPHGLDRCSDEKDWVRLELEHAKKCNKNIIPILLRGFEFPEELPESIDFIRNRNGLAPNTEYWDAFVNRLQEFLTSRRRIPRNRRWIPALAILVVLAVAGFFSYRHFASYPHNRSQRNLTQSLISHMTQNLANFDVITKEYRSGLDRASASVEGKSLHSVTDDRYALSLIIEDLKNLYGQFVEMPDSLEKSLPDSPFDAADIGLFLPSLKDLTQDYISRLTFVRDSVVGNEGTSVKTRLSFLNVLREISEQDSELVFYALNENLLPVTVESELSELKKNTLPYMTTLYTRERFWSTDREQLIGKQQAVVHRYIDLMDELVEAMDDEDSVIEEYVLDEYAALVEAAKASGYENADELQARLDRIQEKQKQIEEKKAHIVELQRKREEVYDRYREKFSPAEGDDYDTLWIKGIIFTSIGLTDDAAQCFTAAEGIGEGDLKTAAVTGRKFALSMGRLDIAGGVVVYGYEEGLPHQAVEIGDVIFEVDGQRVRHFTEYSEATKDRTGEVPVRILRFTPDGETILDGVIDKSLGRMYLLSLTDEDLLTD